MNRRSALLGLFFACVLSLSAASKKPNFVIIFADDQGYADLGCFGAEKIKTPRIDQMAAEGMRLTSFYAHPVCGPSRAALMTGCYPTRIARNDDGKVPHPKMASSEVTLAEVLKPLGYATGMFGKWDLAGHNQFSFNYDLMPTKQGFDVSFVTPGSNDRSVNLLRNDVMIEINADMSQLTRRYTDEALAFIESNADMPFFVYLAHTMPHTRLAVSEDFKGKSAGGLYGDVIEEIDHHAGRVLDRIKELGLDDNTYVIYTSDNGPWWIKKDHGGNAAPLRSAKCAAYEGGVRVPFVIRAPGQVPAGTHSDLVTATIDLLPTIAGIAGGQAPTDRVIDGIDISKVWHGESTGLDRSYFHYQHTSLRAVRRGKWKLHLPHSQADRTKSIIKPWFIHIPPADRIFLDAPVLYDLDADIAETRNVAAANPEVVQRLTTELEAMRKDLGDAAARGVNARPWGTEPYHTKTNKHAIPAPKQQPQAPKKKARSQSKKTPAPAGKPNVIFILMDDMGYSDISCYGATTVRTPHIDRLAAEGLQFTDFHTAASICSPSRAALLTGAYPQRCGLYMGINPKREAHWFLGLNPDEITIAEQFKQQGYATSMIGKWHLGMQEKFLYHHQGFDHYYGAPENMGHSALFLDGRKVIHQNTPLEQLTTLYTERIVQQIAAHKDAPFFIYYAHNYPHTPYKAGPKFRGSSQGGVRGDVIQELDWSIGEMVKALEANGVLENTLIIFTSDNGPTSNAFAKPYSGSKYVSLEGGQRVPFILYWKGQIDKPGLTEVPANAMDLFPTLSTIIGAPLPADRVYDGVSLTPLFTGKPIARSAEAPFFYYNCENLQAVRSGDWKLHVPRTKEQIPWWGRAKQKPIETPRLYNLANDAPEKADVAAQHPERVSQMMKLADQARLKLGEFMTRGSEQRPTGTLFPEVPILSNQAQNWDPLPDAKKGRGKTEFKGHRGKQPATAKKRRKKGQE
ncbi:MAG: arylsulfatase A-like enzyme [Rhodothermales bacterium]|jgi:arylsulfatase A-like enzyme